MPRQGDDFAIIPRIAARNISASTGTCCRKKCPNPSHGHERGKMNARYDTSRRSSGCPPPLELAFVGDITQTEISGRTSNCILCRAMLTRNSLVRAAWRVESPQHANFFSDLMSVDTSTPRTRGKTFASTRRFVAAPRLTSKISGVDARVMELRGQGESGLRVARGDVSLCLDCPELKTALHRHSTIWSRRIAATTHQCRLKVIWNTLIL
jgi:hypothetical protein